MTERNDGGPAFPIPNATDMDGYVYAPEATGMSLRDWFAGQALAGLLTKLTDEELAASAAYLCADAMLKRRDQ